MGLRADSEPELDWGDWGRGPTLLPDTGTFVYETDRSGKVLRQWLIDVVDIRGNRLRLTGDLAYDREKGWLR